MVFDLLDADGLAGEDQAEIDLLSFIADASACGDGDGLVVERVLEIRAGRDSGAGIRRSTPPGTPCRAPGGDVRC